MDFIPEYIARANGEMEITYDIPELEPILNKTYGVIVYQEQLMRISVDLAGFTKGQSDDLRKAVGKKKVKLIAQLFKDMIYGNAEKNIPGMIAKGIPEAKCIKLTEDLENFGKYAFNRSHSVGYALVTNMTAWFKAYYPLEYMTALISSYIGKDDDKIVKYLTNARQMGIKILPPDINKSDYEFTIEGNSIRYGLGSIKGLNKSAVTIITERKANGDFLSLENFLSRFAKKAVNKKSVNVICLSGSLSEIEPTHDRVSVLQAAYKIREDEWTDDILDTFLEDSNTSKAKQMYSKELAESFKMIQIETALLGTYLKEHPLDGKAESIDWEKIHWGDRFDVVGIINEVKMTKTKAKQEDMCFIKLETLEGIRDFTVFPNSYVKLSNKIEPGGIRILSVECSMDKRKPGESSFIVQNIKYFR